MSLKEIYSSGDWNTICDVCGRKYKNTDLRKRWDGLMVCSQDFEERQPQDFVRARADQIAVPWSRPEAQDQFVGVCTVEGGTAIAGLAIGGCAICGTSKTFPDGYAFCTYDTHLGQADYGEADCAYSDNFNGAYVS